MPLLYTPAKRRFDADHPFFDLGNTEARVRHIYAAAEGPGAPCVDGIVDDLLHGTSRPVVCRDPPCSGSVEWPSLRAYERHYDQVHRNRCSTCGAVLPSAHWLDLHIQECHDALFRARAARGDAPYQCFVHTCAHTFSEPQGRRLHMVDAHHFARSFSWDLVRTGLRTAGGDDDKVGGSEDSDGGAQSMEVDELSATFARSLSVGTPRSVSLAHRRRQRQRQH
ncbi:hypothetical protein H4R18_004671 [Coemansia javaensis]|uniref:C2H2-type domain-containing protein n=1 Tax=Coemansia javaensis TaxID=2761396 RepID=A0A9W8LGK0_9FUNG|nr:hypothetical protein H4R18_004671 [Coemansia javaensis]